MTRRTPKTGEPVDALPVAQTPARRRGEAAAGRGPLERGKPTRAGAAARPPDSRASERATIDARTLAALPLDTRAQVSALLADVDLLKAALAAAEARAADLEALADQDALVPLLNRRGFTRALERALAYAARYGARASLVYLDLDGFKKVNDVHGHAAGDRVLVAVADVLRENLRRSDIVGRLGGDEFAIILWAASEEVASAKAGELALRIAALELPERVTASFGVTGLVAEDGALGAIARADAAMYAHKSARRG